MNQDTNITNISEDSGPGNVVTLAKEQILKSQHFLTGKMIGISISESDELESMGYGVAHLKDVLIETARYILISGGKVAYGGDMRPGGFTEIMFDLLAYYKADNKFAPHERFYNFLAYPISTTLADDKTAEFRQIVTFRKIDAPAEFNVPSDVFLKPDSTENLYIWAKSLTKMREEMARECHARLFIGGRSKDYKGVCPGVLEELLISLENKQPVYLAGAFGGIAKAAIDALQGRYSEIFSNEYHLKSAAYQSMFTIYNERNGNTQIDFPSYGKRLADYGIKNLSKVNGLTDAENLRLATSPHVAEIVFLILKGMRNIF